MLQSISNLLVLICRSRDHAMRCRVEGSGRRLDMGLIVRRPRRPVTGGKHQWLRQNAGTIGQCQDEAGEFL